MEARKYIYYGIILSAFINMINSLVYKILENFAVFFNLSYWLVLPTYIVLLCIMLYLVFFRIKIFTPLKWWYLIFLIVIGSLYYVIPSSLSVMSAEYHEMNYEAISLIVPIRSILNFSIIILAIVRYGNVSD